jgi:molecular chaperone DnaK (HSP70)
VTYFLGVDLGTSYTAAAISRDGMLELVSLGTRSLDIPSVTFLDPGGSVVVGESAERRGASDPTRLAREFKRRLGDPAPILVANTPFSAEALMSAVLRAVVADVTQRQGEAPAHVTLTRPANWGPYKQELFSQVPVLADLGPSSTATEPESAAVHFASTTRVASGQSIAVYDLGGGTFDAATLRKTDEGFVTLGSPEGIEHLGGADFDDVVFEYVRRIIGPALAQLDPADPAVRTAAARLRAECVLAKESLSRDTEATIPVTLPGTQTEVRLTRQDFEDAVRPALMATVESLHRAMRSARVTVDQIAATVLAGGSSRIPLVAELITGELQLPVAVATHPKHTVALGAALLAERHSSLNHPLRGPVRRQQDGEMQGPDRPDTDGRGAPQPLQREQRGTAFPWSKSRQAEPVGVMQASVHGASQGPEVYPSSDVALSVSPSPSQDDPAVADARKPSEGRRAVVTVAIVCAVLAITVGIVVGSANRSSAQAIVAGFVTGTLSFTVAYTVMRRTR